MILAASQGIAHGHLFASDLLMLIAAVFFFCGGLLLYSERPDPTHGAMIYFGLCLVAVGLLLL